MQRIPLHDYIAFNNPTGAAKVMGDFGYNIHARNKTELAKTIAEFILREQSEGLLALAQIHPDRELILETAGAKMGADGVVESAGKEIKAPIATESFLPSPSTNSLQNNYTTVLIGGMFSLSFIVLAIIAQK